MQRQAYLKLMFTVSILAASIFGAVRVSMATQIKDIVLQVFQNSLPIYDRPSLKATALQTLVLGQRLIWNGTTQEAEGRRWMQVGFGSVQGWASPGNGDVYVTNPNRITSGFDLSAIIEVEVSRMALHQTPAMNSDITAQVPVGTQLKIIEGPVVADLYSWWEVQTNGASPAKQGWIVDLNAGQLKLIKPLQVYGYNVCDGFNIRVFGVLGWDSIVNSLKFLIPGNEKITCLASGNLKGDKTPVVVVLSRLPGKTKSPIDGTDTLRIYDQHEAANVWSKIYEKTTNGFALTEDLSLHDVVGDGKPLLLWTSRNDGTGHYLEITVLRYSTAAGMQPVLSEPSLYKGTVQVGEGNIVLLGGYLRDDEPNCCGTGLVRIGYAWQNNEFVKTVDEILQNPGLFQGAQK